MPQIVEQRADIGIGGGEYGQPIATTYAGQDQHTIGELKHRNTKLTLAQPLAQPIGVLRQRGRERGGSLRLEGAAGRVLDGQTVATEEQDATHALARGEALDYFRQSSHRPVLHTMEKGERNVGVACSEVKKPEEVDPL